MKNTTLILVIAVSVFSASMPDIVLDGSIFSGKTSFIYSLVDTKTGEELVETKVTVEVEEGMLLIEDSINESFVSVKYPSLEPFHGEKTIHYNGDYHIISQFRGDSVIIDAQTPQGEQNLALKIPRRPVLHNDQLLFSIPAMDFSIPKQGLSLFIPSNASFIDMAVLVKGKTKTKTSAGEFEVYKVAFDFGTEMQYGYYHVEKPHHLIIYDNGKLEYRLQGIVVE